MKKLLLVVICLFCLFSCKKDDDSNKPVNPEITLEENEKIEKTLYASLSEEYVNTNLIDDYYLELTNKGNFYFTASFKEDLGDINLSDKKISYKGTYQETETKLLLTYNEYDILGINEFTKIDGLYILEDKGIAFSTRQTNLLETNYLGLYYSIIDGLIYSIELKTNNEAIVRINDEIYYSTYIAKVSNIFIRELNMNLILNGTNLIYGDNTFKRYSFSNVQPVGYITNLKKSMLINENFDLLGKYIDVCYSDFTKNRYYITSDMIEKKDLKPGVNTFKINLGETIYDYEFEVISYTDLVDKLNYEGSDYCYFKVTYKEGLVLRYKSTYNTNVTLLNEQFNLIDKSNMKNNSFLLDGSSSIYYIKFEGKEIEVELEEILPSIVDVSGEYSYTNDEIGVYLNLFDDKTFKFYILSKLEKNEFTGTYEIVDGKVVITGDELSIYDSGNYLSYNGLLLEKKNKEVIFGYIENEEVTQNLNFDNLNKVYLTSDGIITEKLDSNEIIGYSKDYYGNYKLVCLIKGEYYIFYDFDNNYIIDYNDTNKVSNINTNIFYKLECSGLYNINLSNTNSFEISIYDKDFNLVDELINETNLELNGTYYFKVNNNDKTDVRLLINELNNTNLSGVYKSGDSYIDFDKLLFDGVSFTYDDKLIKTDVDVKYENYGDLLVINNLVYRKNKYLAGDGVYRLKSNNEVMIVEIKNQEITYIYTSLDQETETEYDANIVKSDYIKSTVGDIYYYNYLEEGIILSKNNKTYNLVLSDEKTSIVDSRVSFNKTTFFINDQLSSEDITINVLYSNGAIENIDYSDTMIKYFSTKSVGEFRYSLFIGNEEYKCSYTVLPKEKIYTSKTLKETQIMSKVYEFKPTINGDYLISVESSNYFEYELSIYSDYNLKSLIHQTKSNSFYASDIVNCIKNKTYYVYVKMPQRSDITISVKSDTSLIGTYTYNDNKLIINSNKTFEFNDYENSLRYIGTYESNGKNNYKLIVSKQFQIDQSSYNEVNITVPVIDILVYGNIIVLDGLSYVNVFNEIDYVGTYYSINDGVVNRIELTSNQSIGGGLLKIIKNSIDSDIISTSYKYSVEGSLLKADKTGYLYIENGYVMLNYDSLTYIKINEIDGLNKAKIDLDMTLNLNKEPIFSGYITLLYNNSKKEVIEIDKSMIYNYNSLTNKLGEVEVLIQYKNYAFTMTFLVEE